MYDLIGDIHGYANELVQLLEYLGYQLQEGVYRHPERKVIFLGDFIDRGPKIREVLEIVRSMMEEGQALAVMGNHEWNALAYHSEDPDRPGEFLRRHCQKNVHQHRQTIEQLQPDQLRFYLTWFRTLPLWLDLPGLRVVHACWDDPSIQALTLALEKHRGITDSFLLSASTERKPFFAPLEIVLKGKEAKLPNGLSFRDKEGHVRTEIRTKWYMSPTTSHTYGDYALQADPVQCPIKLEESLVARATSYPATGKPVFVGHYWLLAERPERLADNVACLDYSVAKDGFLCGYRWDGEQKLKNENFAWVGDGRRPCPAGASACKIC